MITRASRRHPATATPRGQYGIILLIAMIASVLLTIAGVTLVRAMSGGVTIGGNLAAQQQGTTAASAALENAVATLFASGSIDTRSDDAAHHYFATRQAGEDSRGIPAMLQAVRTYPPESPVLDAGDGYSARYVIERLCLSPGDATVLHCTLSPLSAAAASGAPPVGEPPREPYFRVTIRLDGPAALTAFVQSTLSGTHRNPRLSWYVLDE